MPLRLAFDLDGTVADLHSALEREVATLFPDLEPQDLELPDSTSAELPVSEDPDSRPPDEEADPPPDSTLRRLTSVQQTRLWTHVQQTHDFWMSLDEIVPGAIARLATLAQERRWEVLFITTRPQTAGDTVQRQSQRWLESQGFLMPSVFVVRGSRGKVARALRLDAVVDDRPENCVDVVSDSSACAVLIWPDGSEVPVETIERRVVGLGIAPLPTIGDCLDILESLDPTAHPRAMRRMLRKRLGLKPSTSSDDR